MEDRGWGDPAHLRRSPDVGHPGDSVVRRTLRTAIDYLPRGNTLDAETFNRRHNLLCWILGLHILPLWAFGLWQGFDLWHVTLEVAVPAALLVFARLSRNRRFAAFFATAGLVFCSSLLVHLSRGTIEAHFHFFILLGFIALYQDWVPFAWNVAFVVLSHGIGNAWSSDSMYNHYAALNRPWLWACIHGVAVLAACVGLIIFWKNTELEQQRSAALASELAASQVAAAQAEAAQRQTISELLINLARRNQSLLDRQLDVVAELEQRETDPVTMAELFRLDHLATRIRRNAESLIVLSGDEPPRLWGQPVALSEVVRAAAAEVEDYSRVEVLVTDYLDVAGGSVADLSHLLAELIENATVFSPPTYEVRVRTHLVPGEPTEPVQGAAFALSIEDMGIGMSDADLSAANELLAEPPDVDPRRSTLGFHVVSRLAQRLGLRVRLAHTPGGGVTALVTLPDGVVGERRPWEPGTATVAGVAPPQALPPLPGVPAPAAVTASVAVDVTPPSDTPLPDTAPPDKPPRPPSPRVIEDEPRPPTTADGLTRRIPGASLAPALRRSPGQDPGENPLSRFQAAQRAGREATEERRNGPEPSP